MAKKASDIDPRRSMALDVLQSVRLLNHNRSKYTGVNLLLGDGSVRWATDVELWNLQDEGISAMSDRRLWREVIQFLEN